MFVRSLAFPMSNLQRITLLSFLAYFVMSGMMAPIGIISGVMAELFDKPITDVTAQFSWLTVGNLVGAVIALFVFEWISLKHLMMLVYALILVSLLSLNLVTDLTMIGMALGVVGIGSGLGLAGAALVISRSYDADRRASMLVITDGCFSAAANVCSAIAVFLVARAFHWAATYQFVALVAAMVLVLAITSRLPATKAGEDGPVSSGRWPLSVWYCLGALFLYTLGQYSMLWWLPN